MSSAGSAPASSPAGTTRSGSLQSAGGQPPPPPLCFEHVDYVAGEFLPSTVELSEWLLDCNTGERICPMRAADIDTVIQAVQTAYRVHKRGSWQNMPIGQRCDFLDRFAKEIEKYEEEMSRYDAVNTGVPITMTRLINASLKMVFADVASKLRRHSFSSTLAGVHGPVEVVRRAWGPVLILCPWNVPAGTVAPKVAAALAAGCPVLLKPSEWAPFSLQLFARAMHAAGIPAGVFQLLNGDAAIGKQLVSDPIVRCVHFTGSAHSGRLVGMQCAGFMKPFMCELGGSNPMVVLPDADLDQAADGVIAGLTTLNGQWCCGVGRLLVHQSVKDALLQKVRARLRDVKVGASTDPETGFGPMSNPLNYRVVKQAIADMAAAGATIVQDTPVPERGLFIPPTLIDGADRKHALAEIFGPVAVVMPFSSETEAVQICNEAPGILLASVFGRDRDAAIRCGHQIETGMVMINGIGFGFELQDGVPEPRMTFWGSAGYGEDGPLDALLHFFSGNRIVGINGLTEAVSAGTAGRTGAAAAAFSMADVARRRLYHRLRIV